MPIYEYACPTCGHHFEKLQRVGADAPTCPACGDAHASRKVSLSSFQLKGSGFYSTDYKSNGGGAPDGGGSSGAAEGGGGHSCGSGCGCAH